jgi:hypothetical protein
MYAWSTSCVPLEDRGVRDIDYSHVRPWEEGLTLVGTIGVRFGRSKSLAEDLTISPA